MASLEELQNGLIKADAAGNTEDAKAFADAIRGMQGSSIAPKELGGLQKAELGAHGFNDAVAETLGALPDLVSKPLRPLGLAPQEPNFYTNKLKGWINDLGGPSKEDAQSGTDKFIYRAGHGVGDAASMYMPAAAVSKIAPTGSMAERIATILASQPGMQSISGAIGEGTEGATGSPVAGIGAAMATPIALNAAAHVISPAINQLTPEKQRLVQILKGENVPLTAGQETGSKPLQTLESVLENLPFSSGMASKEKAAQQAAFNSAVLSKAGIAADAATPDILANQRDTLGKIYNQIASQSGVNLDNKFLTDLQDVASKYGNKLPSQTKEVFYNYVDDVLNSGNKLSGETYQVTRSDLGRQVKALANSDPALSNALGGLKSALDSAFNRSVPQALQDQLSDTNAKYRNLKTILRAMSAQGAMPASGDISPAQLYSSARNAVTRDQFAMGAGDLNDLARAGQVFIKPQVPNSGTAQRSFMQNALTGSLPLGGYMAGNIPGAAVGVGMPPLVQALISSKAGKAYLTNQLARDITPKLTPQLLAAQLAAREKNNLLGYEDQK